MFTSATRDQVVAVVVRELSPFVGATMAAASVRGFCTKLELDLPRLHRAQVTKLIEAIAPGLDVYIGKDKSRTVVHAIWTALDTMEGT